MWKKNVLIHGIFFMMHSFFEKLPKFWCLLKTHYRYNFGDRALQILNLVAY